MTKFYENNGKKIGFAPKAQAYIQHITLKKTLESISSNIEKNPTFQKRLLKLLRKRE